MSTHYAEARSGGAGPPTVVHRGSRSWLGMLLRRARFGLLARVRHYQDRMWPSSELHVYTSRFGMDGAAPAVVCDDIAFMEVDRAAIERDPARYASSARSARVCLAGGGRCFVGLAGNDVALRMWALPLNETATDRLAPGAHLFGPTVFVHECWTDPEFRGRSIYAAGLIWLSRRLGVEGARQLIMTVTARNVPAMRACEKAGFANVGPFQLAVGGAAAPAPQETREEGPGDAAGDQQSRVRAVRPSALLGVAADLIRLRGSAWIIGTGHSMYPTFRDGDAVLLGAPARLRRGDIVLYTRGGLPIVHRVQNITGDAIRTRGDAARVADAWIKASDVIGVALAKASYVAASGGEPRGFRLIASAESERWLGPVTPVTLTLRFGSLGVLRFVQSRAVLAVRRLLLGCGLLAPVQRLRRALPIAARR